MLYICLTDCEKNNIPKSYNNIPTFFKNMIHYFAKKDFIELWHNWRGYFLEKKIEDKNILILKNLKTNTLKKLDKYLKVNCVKNVCISDELRTNKEFNDFLLRQAINIFDGRWLYKHMMIKIIEFVVQNKKEKMEYQEISILVNEIDDIILENIYQIASKIKLLNIITDNENKFKKIEKKIYEEKGIILNINNNYKKSLLKSDIIINVDFNEENLNKYTFPRNACLINLKNEVQIKSKSFEGINTNFFEITMPQKYVKLQSNFKKFNLPILYESFIYKRTCSINIKKQIEDDGAKISYLIGSNGIIRKNEYLNLSKNKKSFV